MRETIDYFLVRFALVIGISAITAWLLTPAVRWCATRLGMVDIPDARRINTRPIPRGGGVAVFIAFHLSLLVTEWLTPGLLLGSLGQSWHPTFFVASSVLLLIGLLDDAFSLPPLLKLAGQIVAATILFKLGARVGQVLWFPMPGFVDYGFTLIWYIGIINAFNLIDGMDGLASGLALIGAVGLAVCLMTRHYASEALPLLALAGACLGFLRYNFHPASIFLGDSGSMFLGLVLATIPLLTGGKSEFLAAVGVPLLVMGVPLFDTILAIWRRSIRSALPALVEGGGSHRVMQPDKEHLHHRVLALGLNQRRAAWFLYGASGVMVGTAVLASFFQNRATGIVLLGFLTVALVLARHLTKVELWDTGRALLHVARTPILNRLFLPIYLFWDIAAIAICWFVSSRLAHVPLTRFHLLLPLPIFTVTIIIILSLMRTYQRSWHHARLRDYAILSLSLLLGWSLGTATIILFGLRFAGWWRQSIILLLALPSPILGIRLLREMVAESLQVIESSRHHEGSDQRQVVAYGGGRAFACYLQASAASHNPTLHAIIGIIDDNIALSGRLIHGYPVLGRPSDLKGLIKKYNINGVIITAELTPERRLAIIHATRELGLWLREWRWAEVTVDDSPTLPDREPAPDNEP